MFKKILVRKLGLSVIFAFICAGIVFIFLQRLSAHKIEAKYNDSAYWEKRMEKEVANFQHYITENDIAIHDFYKISKWIDKAKITTISLYYEDRMIYDSTIPYWAGTLGSGVSHKPLPWEKLYKIRFKDAEGLLSLTVYLKHYDYDVAILLNLAAFFTVFLGIVLLFVHRKTSYILKLDQQVLLMQGGKLDITIPIKGNDEITSLAENINEMRQIFIRQKQVQEASKNFSATMSHDIRTPLAILIGYLDIVVHKRTVDEQRLQQYLNKSIEKANQLKGLTDHLFEYYSSSEYKQLSAETRLSSTDFERIISDEIFLLKHNGFSVKTTFDNHTDYYIQISRQAMERILDNLFSNILRYGEITQPIYVKTILKKKFLIIYLKNKIALSTKYSEGAGIGVQNTLAILNEYHGQMVKTQFENNYLVKILIPVD